MTPSIYLFLDIDGVLRIPRDGEYAVYDKGAISRVRWFASAWNAGIVITSTWRYVRPLSFFQDKISPNVIAETPRFERDGPCVRHLEIKQWLDKSGIHKRWVALDDRPDLFFRQAGNLVLCNPLQGFDIPTFNRLIDLSMELFPETAPAHTIS